MIHMYYGSGDFRNVFRNDENPDLGGADFSGMQLAALVLGTILSFGVALYATYKVSMEDVKALKDGTTLVLPSDAREVTGANKVSRQYERYAIPRATYTVTYNAADGSTKTQSYNYRDVGQRVRLVAPEGLEQKIGE